MFTISHIDGHPLKRVLECVWSLCDGKLNCAWVEPHRQIEAGDCSPEQQLDLNQKVA
jgi:hypothetical protein